MDEQRMLPSPEKMAEPVTRYVEAMSSGITEMAQCYSDFVQTRCRHMTEALGDIAQSGQNPTKAVEVQINWMKTTLTDYAEHNQNLLALSTRIMDTWAGRSKEMFSRK